MSDRGDDSFATILYFGSEYNKHVYRAAILY
jgi:hypothetical protein